MYEFAYTIGRYAEYGAKVYEFSYTLEGLAQLRASAVPALACPLIRE